MSLAMLIAIIPQGMAASAADIPMSIVDLKTDGLTDPLGIDTAEPVFSWKMDSNLVGIQQTAYQITVRDDKNHIVWDSGVKEDSVSTAIPYEGEALVAATPYTWTVTVTDNRGNTIVSDPATFETGLMSTEQWDAEWIGGDLTLDARTLRMFEYTADLRIPEGSTKASVIVFADEYRLENSVFNTQRLENDNNYMRYEVDVTDENAPKLNIYVVGYSDSAEDPENIPNRTYDIPPQH